MEKLNEFNSRVHIEFRWQHSSEAKNSSSYSPGLPAICLLVLMDITIPEVDGSITQSIVNERITPSDSDLKFDFLYGPEPEDEYGWLLAKEFYIKLQKEILIFDEERIVVFTDQDSDSTFIMEQYEVKGHQLKWNRFDILPQVMDFLKDVCEPSYFKQVKFDFVEGILNPIQVTANIPDNSQQYISHFIDFLLDQYFSSDEKLYFKMKHQL